MKRPLLISSAVFILTVAHSQTGQNTFCIAINACNTVQGEGADCVIQTTDGSYVIAGETSDIVGNFTGSDAYIAKIDSTGSVLQWKKAYGASTQTADAFWTIKQTTDGGYITAGVSDDALYNDRSFIAKMDNIGNIQWSYTIGSGEIYSVIQTYDGGYACAGRTSGSGLKFAAIIKFDNTGTLKWYKTVQLSGTDYVAHSIVETDNKDLIISGEYWSSGNFGALIAKFDSAGTKKWSKVIANKRAGNSLIKSNDGGYLFFSDDISQTYCALIKVDSAGDLQWTKKITGINYRNALIQTQDGGYACTAVESLSNTNILVKLDSTFNIQWSKVIANGLFSLIQAKDKGFVLTGKVGYPYENFFIVKLDSMGNGCCSYGPIALTIGPEILTQFTSGNSAVGPPATNWVGLTASVGTLLNACSPVGVTTTVIQPSCFGDCDGSATATPSGGWWPYTYQWSNGQTTATATGLCAGTYTVEVIDALPDTAFKNVTVTQPAVLSANMNITNASACSVNDGSISANVSGGTSPYSYSWSNGSSTSAITGLFAGTYTLTITDANGCTQPFMATVTCPSGIMENSISKITSITPNPFSRQTVLQTESYLNNATLTVDNCFGQIVAQIKNISGQTIVFNRDNLPSGLYFVRLTEDNKVIAVDKFVISDK